MRYLGLCVLIGLVFLGCTPSVGTNTPPDFVTARFDPATVPPDVPAPTDLAIDPDTKRIKIDVPPGTSAAEAEFIAFLNTLEGFPPDTPAIANFDASLQPSSVNADTVRVIDLTTGVPVTLTPVYATVGSPPKGQIVLQPPDAPSPRQPSGWTIGHQYLVALIAGPNGLTGLQGQPVVSSAAFGLLKATNPLVTCPNNLADPNCRSTTDLIPSSETDPAKRIADQATKAKALERIRQGYAPLFQRLGTDRSNIPLLWTFTILPRPQATFDPANLVVPFPNNLATLPTGDGGVRVHLTPPDGGSPLVVALYQGLNTLDGFSTTAPIVSENSDPLPALTKGTLDPSTMVDGGTGVLNLNLAGLQPQIRPCLTDVPNGNCVTFTTPDGGAPEQLQLIPTVPLLERTNYIAYFTTKLKDTQGNAVAPTTAFALMRNRNPLIDSSRNSTISTVPTPLAQQLEPARQVMFTGLNILESATGITREQLVVASVFTTQSEGTALAQLRAAASGVSANPVFVYRTASTIFEGEIVSPNLLDPVSEVFNPGNPRPERIAFLLLLPGPTAPPNGWPVTIFGHGLTRVRTDASSLYLADNLPFPQAGQAVIAIDAVWHGDRAICTGSVPFLNSGASACGVVAGTTDDIACASGGSIPPAYCCEDPQTCPLFATSAGRCVAVHDSDRTSCDSPPGGMPGDVYCRLRSPNQGHCVTDPGATTKHCEGAYFRIETNNPRTAPCVSGQNILNLTNLFATRDNFRQQVIDLTQLARAIQATGTGSLNDQLGPTHALDPTRITYLGQSLGGILGALYTSVAPEVKNVVLNVPGSDLPLILLTSPTFRPARDQFLATLAAQNPPILFGTPEFDDFIGVAKWILDPGDPINAGYGLLNGPGLPATRKALIQYITHDQVIPNPPTDELINAANQTVPTGRQVDRCLFDPLVCMQPPCSCPSPGSPLCEIPLDPPSERHGFLLNFTPHFGDALTTRSQTQAVNYLTGSAPFICP